MDTPPPFCGPQLPLGPQARVQRRLHHQWEQEVAFSVQDAKPGLAGGEPSWAHSIVCNSIWSTWCCWMWGIRFQDWLAWVLTFSFENQPDKISGTLCTPCLLLQSRVTPHSGTTRSVMSLSPFPIGIGLRPCPCLGTSLLIPNLFFWMIRLVRTEFLFAIASARLTIPFQPILLSERSSTLSRRRVRIRFSIGWGSG